MRSSRRRRRIASPKAGCVPRVRITSTRIVWTSASFNSLSSEGSEGLGPGGKGRKKGRETLLLKTTFIFFSVLVSLQNPIFPLIFSHPFPTNQQKFFEKNKNPKGPSVSASASLPLQSIIGHCLAHSAARATAEPSSSAVSSLIGAKS